MSNCVDFSQGGKFKKRDIVSVKKTSSFSLRNHKKSTETSNRWCIEFLKPTWLFFVALINTQKNISEITPFSKNTTRARIFMAQPRGKIHDNFFPTRDVAGIPPLSRDADHKPRIGGNRHRETWNDKKRFCWERLKKSLRNKKDHWKKRKSKIVLWENISTLPCSYVFLLVPSSSRCVPLCSIYFYLLLVTFLYLVVEPPIWKISIKLDHFSK